jgi:hypothetical protein
VQTITDDVWWKLVHLAPLAGCMTTADGRVAADFVLRWDHMQEDLPELLQQLNARPDIPKLRLGQQFRQQNVWQRCTGKSKSGLQHSRVVHKKDSHTWLGFEPKERYCNIEEYYTGRHVHCEAGVTAYFAEDLQLLSGSGVTES